MSNTTLSHATLEAVRKAIKGHREDLIVKSGRTRQTVDNALNGYYIRDGKRKPYHNESIIKLAIEIIERERTIKQDLENKIKAIT